MGQRRYRTLAAYVGGAATMAGALVAGLISGQVLYARRTIPGAQAPPPQCGGRYGRQYEGEPISLAVLGDSTAAGYGVHTRAQTPGAMLATAVADHTRRPVVLTCTAAVGSPSAWLPAQAENVLDAGGADLAVIFIGANDVTGSVDAEQAVAFLAEAVRALRRAGSEVVVATCPDLGSIPPIMPPLRWLVRRWSRQMARAQRRAVEAEGAYTVPLGELLGPVFDADPDTLFGPDRYHPSAAGYRAAVDVVLPTVLSVLDGALSRRSTGAADGDGAGGDGTGGDGTGGARGEDATKGAGADVAGRTPGGAVPCVSQSHSNA
jgi:lysophospholipase L1-like esterase